MADKTVGTAIFIDHHGELGSLGLHGLQKVGGQHGGRREKNLAHQPGIGNRLFQIDPRKIIEPSRAMQAYQGKLGSLEKELPFDGLFETQYYERAIKTGG